MATAKRYQSSQPRQALRGVDPFSYARGIQTPPAPTIPMPPSPAGSAPPAPPGPPHIYEPRNTPAEQRMKGAIAQASQLSQILGDWGDRFYKQAAAEAEKTGYETGVAYGQQTLPRGDTLELRGGTTIYDVAFDKGARLAYSGQIELDAKRSLQDYELRNPADVKTFDQLAKSYRDSTLAEIGDPLVKAKATQSIDDLIFSHRSRILKQEFLNNRQAQHISFDESLRLKNNEVSIAIDEGDHNRALNLIAKREEVINEAVASMLIPSEEAGDKLKRQLRENDIVSFAAEQYEKDLEAGNGDLAYKIFADELSHVFIQNTKTGEIRLVPISETREPEGKYYTGGEYGRAKDYDPDDPESDFGTELPKWVKVIGEANPMLPGGMSEELHEKIRQRLWNKRAKHNTLGAAKRSAATAEAKAFKAKVTEQVDDAITSLQAGYLPPNLGQTQEQVDLLKGSDPTGWNTLNQKLNKERALYDSLLEFKQMTLPEQERYLLENWPEPGAEVHGDVVTWLDRAEKLHNEIMSDINNGDGLERAIKDGIIERSDLFDVDIRSIAGLVDHFAARKMLKMKAEEHYGVAIDAFTTHEIAVMARQWNEIQNTDEKLQLVTAAVAGLGDASLELFKKLDKTVGSDLGIVGSLVLEGGTGPETGRQIMLGSEIKTSKDFKDIMPKSSDLNIALHESLGNALGMGGLEVKGAVMSAVKSLYAFRAYNENDWMQEIENVDALVQAVTGGIVKLEWNKHSAWNDPDYKVMVPQRGYTKDQMDDWLESITARDIAALGGVANMFAEDVAKLINNGELRLHTIGGFGEDVRYLLETHQGNFLLSNTKLADPTDPDSQPAPFELYLRGIGVNVPEVTSGAEVKNDLGSE